jgi:hypothetical protein
MSRHVLSFATTNVVTTDNKFDEHKQANENKQWVDIE